MEKEIFDALCNIINQSFEQYYGLREIKPEDSLKDLGFNSIAFIKIMILIEERFDIEIDDNETEVSDYKTIGDIVKLVSQKINNKNI